MLQGLLLLLLLMVVVMGVVIVVSIAMRMMVGGGCVMIGLDMVTQGFHIVIDNRDTG